MKKPLSIHGDYRLDNMVFDPETSEVKAVLDWELSTLGDPLGNNVYALVLSDVERVPSLRNILKSDMVFQPKNNIFQDIAS